MADFTAEQAQAISTLDANVAVVAGAGAGKTRVLVERYINILAQERASCDEILAITFTNKAAKEMKERIAQRAAVLADTAGEEEGRRWRAVTGELEYAPIGTFHSFCARVLRENPVEAGLDPNFAVLDEVEAALLAEKALAEVMEAGLAEGAAWLDRLLTAYDRPLLLALAPELYEKLTAQGLVDEGLTERLSAPYHASLATADGLKAELSGLCGELIAYKDKLKKTGAQYTRVDKLARDWDRVAAAISAVDTDPAEDTLVGQYLDSLDRRSGDKEIVGDIREHLKRLRQVQADRAALELVPAFCQLFSALAAALAKHQSEQRALTFNDLEVRTARLLSEYPAVKRKYLNRIQFIMVDEFQDTNDLQRRIIYLVAGGDAERLNGKKLFIVGDGKQSIYRFRGADVAVFERVRQDIAASGGEIIGLDVNFRSLDGLLTLYNECFATIMGTAEDVITFQPLAAFRCAAGPEEARAEFIAIAKGDQGDGGEPREAEATAIAARIRAMVEGGEALIGRDTAPRPVRFGDIAVLFRTATDIDTYAAALQSAGVPYYVVGGKGFYHCQEILDLLNLLQVVDNRCHETALAGALRSPLFLLSDATLAKLKAAQKEAGGSLWQGLADSGKAAGLSDGQRQAAARAWEIINRLRSLRGAMGLAALIRLALIETGYLNFVLTQFMGHQKYANLLKLAAVARDFESKGPFGLGDFLRYVARLVDGEVREGEAQVESESGDTVKLMTIHRAKGLEYPVVFVPDLHRRFRDETGAVLFSPDQGLGLKVPGGDGELKPTSLHAAIAARERKLSFLELKRLLYVAFTRAKDYLILSAVGGKVAGGKDFTELSTWLSWLGKVYGFCEMDALPDRLAVDKAAILVHRGTGGNAAAPSPAVGDATEVAVGGWLETVERRLAPLPAVRPEPVFNVSGFDRFWRCPRSFYYATVAGLPEPPLAYEAVATGPPGRVVGDALHRCLELWAPGLPADECLARAVAETVPAVWREAVTAAARPLLARYAASDFARETDGLPVRKEWRFVFPLPDPAGEAAYIFTGRADCMVTYPDGSLGIIDYKTDKVKDGEVGVKKAAYARQLALYAMAAEAAGLGPVRDARLYFLRPGLAVAVPVDEPARAAIAADLLTVCRHVRRYTDEGAYQCNREWCPHCNYRVLCRGC